VPGSLAGLILRLLAKDPAHRPQSAREVARLLAPAVEALPADDGPRPEFDFDAEDTEVVPQALPAGSEAARSPKRRRGRAGLLFGVATAILLIGGLTAYKLVFETKDGTLVVEIDDKDVEARFKDGELQVVADGVVKYRLKPSERNRSVEPGKYRIRVAGADGLTVDVEEFELRKGDRRTVRVTRARPAGPGPRSGPTAPVASVRKPPPGQFINSLDMAFALVPKGKAWLGGGGGKPGDRQVEFQDDFYLGAYPVTQEEWQKVTGANLAHYSRNGFRKEAVNDIPDADLKRFPVEGVSCADIEAFLAKLNEKAKDPGWVYRLPTSDEWEYACRGGPIDRAASAFWFYAGEPSNELPPDRANYAHPGGPNRTVKVGQYPPNRLGLYDMHGNVLEWCSDAGKNAIGEDTRLAHGGSWNDPAGTAASTIPFLPTVRYASLGVRVVRARVPGK